MRIQHIARRCENALAILVELSNLLQQLWCLVLCWGEGNGPQVVDAVAMLLVLPVTQVPLNEERPQHSLRRKRARQPAIKITIKPSVNPQLYSS
jgi:hypothetical protein